MIKISSSNGNAPNPLFRLAVFTIKGNAHPPHRSVLRRRHFDVDGWMAGKFSQGQACATPTAAVYPAGVAFHLHKIDGKIIIISPKPNGWTRVINNAKFEKGSSMFLGLTVEFYAQWTRCGILKGIFVSFAEQEKRANNRQHQNCSKSSHLLTLPFAMMISKYYDYVCRYDKHVRPEWFNKWRDIRKAAWNQAVVHFGNAFFAIAIKATGNWNA